MNVGESRICRVGLQAGDPKKNQSCSFCLNAICWQNSLLLGGGKSFVLFKPSTDWIGPTTLLYLKSTYINVHLILIHSHGNIQNHIWHIFEHWDPGKFTHKINHHIEGRIKCSQTFQASQSSPHMCPFLWASEKDGYFSKTREWSQKEKPWT